MKATGIIRRIDDLGRVVIPKEIRRNLRISEGEPLELFVEDGGVIFKKYDVCTTISEALKDLDTVLQDTDGIKCKPAIVGKISEIKALLKAEQVAEGSETK